MHFNSHRKVFINKSVVLGSQIIPQIFTTTLMWQIFVNSCLSLTHISTFFFNSQLTLTLLAKKLCNNVFVCVTRFFFFLNKIHYYYKGLILVNPFEASIWGVKHACTISIAQGHYLKSINLMLELSALMPVALVHQLQKSQTPLIIVAISKGSREFRQDIYKGLDRSTIVIILWQLNQRLVGLEWYPTGNMIIIKIGLQVLCLWHPLTSSR